MTEHIADETLAAFADGRVAQDERSRVEAHLSRCSSCRQALAETLAILAGRVQAPRPFLDRALNRPPAARTLLLRPAFGIAAVLLVAVVAAGFFFIGRGRPPLPAQGAEPAAAAPAALPVVGKDKAAVSRPRREAEAGTAVALEQEKQVVAAKAGRPAAGASGVPQPPRFAGQDELQRPLKGEQDGTGRREEPAAEAVANAVEEAPAGQRGQSAPAALTAQKARFRETAPTADSQQWPGVSGPNAMQAARQMFIAASGRAGALQALPPLMLADEETVCIHGEAGQSDLVDRGQLAGWRPLPAGLLLELAIDGAGRVASVEALGVWEPAERTAAERWARELQFTPSERKERRALLACTPR